MRSSLLFSLCCAVAACDPVQSAAIAIAPRPEVPVDSARQSALAVVSRVVGRHGLEPILPPESWEWCFGKSSVILCGKVLDLEIQFRLSQWIGFSPLADSVRRDLVDSLEAHFGERRVRQCEWRQARDRRRSGCPPLAQRD